MWNRSELKSNAKLALKANYWKAVLVGLILSFILGSGSTAAQNSARSSTDGLTDIDPVMVFTVIGIILAAVFVAMVISILLSIFIWNPLEVGCQKFFINCKYGNAELGDIAYGFKNGYAHIGMIMFLRGLFTGLWMLLFIIPGIVKSYEYMMIPYLLAEHPEMTRQEAFAESKQMMDGKQMGCICVRSFIYRLDAVRCLHIWYSSCFLCRTLHISDTRRTVSCIKK